MTVQPQFQSVGGQRGKLSPSKTFKLNISITQNEIAYLSRSSSKDT